VEPWVLGQIEILTDWTGNFGAGQALARWGHYVAGAAWIGLLVYFNFVQAPAFGTMRDATRAEVLSEITRRAMQWRFWSAVATVATGVLILVFQQPMEGDYLSYFTTSRGTAIAFGSVLGIIMFANVWMVIAPNQRLVGEAAAQVAQGRPRPPGSALAAKRLARAERCNVLLAVPMLWFMAAAPHFADGAFRFQTQPGRDYLGAGWTVFIIMVGVIELSALGQIGGYDTKTNRWLFDRGRWTLLWGLGLWFVLWFGVFEFLWGSA
jgi:uncharacterized membrane protein